MPAPILWTDTQVADFVSSYKSGESMDSIGRRYGVSCRPIERTLRSLNCPIRTSHEHVRKDHFDEQFFDDIDTEAKAYWLGFICADGHIRDGRYLQVALAEKDRTHLELLRGDLNSTSRIKAFKARNTSRNTEHPAASLVVCSRRMHDRLARLGILLKNKRRAVPECVPDELQPAYYRGLIDGDGWLHRAKIGVDRSVRQWTVGLVGFRQVVDSFRDFVSSRTGWVGSVGNHPSEGIFTVNFSGNRQAMEIAELLYSGATRFLARKYELYQQIRSEHWPIPAKCRLFDSNGETHSIAEWAEITGLHKRIITTRLWRGQPLEAALSTPGCRPHRLFTHNGETHSIAEWATITGLHKRIITTRLWRGWSVEAALTTPA